MKSYSEHLKSTKSFGEEMSKNYKPTMRSSAIFPLILINNKIDSIYTFMGYWLKKRNINLVTVILTIRNEIGEKILVKSIEVKSTKSYVFKSSELLKDLKDFKGSIEIEIYSAVDMVFPYPAITFALKGVQGITFVHTCGRIYNDIDDLNQNEKFQVAETGFDVFIDKKYKPFFAFVNGPIHLKSEVFKLELIDQSGRSHFFNRKIINIPPYGLCWINIFKNNNERKLFKNEKISLKIFHNFRGFFPRFVAGNELNDRSNISLTHSYYDTSKDTNKDNKFLNPNKNEFYDSVIAIPYDRSFDEIELAIYPNFIHCPCFLNFELYDLDGNLLDTSNKKIKIANRNNSTMYIKMSELFNFKKNIINFGMIKIIIDGRGKVPTRMKFGLNLIKEKNKLNLPSNVCFNAKIPNKNIINKKSTFRWCALFDPNNQSIYLHNTSFIKTGFGNSDVEIEICRESDDSKIKFKKVIKQNGTIEVVSDRNEEISNFLSNEIGWITFSCSNPFVTGYYVTDFKKGVVGADHLY